MRRARGTVDKNWDNIRAEFRRKKNVAKRVVKKKIREDGMRGLVESSRKILEGIKSYFGKK